MTCAGEILQGGFRIFAPALLAGMEEVALAVAAVIKSQDVESGFVKGHESVDGVAEVAGFAVEVNGGVAWLRCGGNPPAMKLRVARSSGGEADRFKREIHACRRSRNSGCRVIEQLPTALPEENAQGAPRAKERSEQNEDESAEQPSSRDGGGRRVGDQEMWAAPRIADWSGFFWTDWSCSSSFAC